MCKGQKAVAALSLLGCGQLLPDVFSLSPEPQWMWMDSVSFSPVSTKALCPQAEDEAWQRQGTSNTFPVPWICAPCVRLIPCPGLSPACAQGRCHFVVTSLASGLKLCKQGHCQGLSCQAYPALTSPMCSQELVWRRHLSASRLPCETSFPVGQCSALVWPL